jgi:Peptidase family M28
MRYSVLSGEVAARRDARPVAGTPGGHWARLGEHTVVWTADTDLTAAAERGGAGLLVDAAEAREATGRLYLVVQVGRAFQQEHPSARVVVDKGRHLVVDLRADELAAVGTSELCWMVRPLPADRVVVDRPPPPAVRAPTPELQALVASVSRDSYASFLTELATVPTRHSLSQQFGEAARRAVDTFLGLGYQASMAPVAVLGATSHNVVADRLGRAQEPRDLVLVTAHLDSVNLAGGVGAAAPGADDNASGAAGVLEIGRVLAQHDGAHDLRLILFGGEEQGLFGSSQYVAGLPAAERARIRAVVNMDMVATRNTVDPTVLLEGGAVSQPLMGELADAAATFTSLTVETSLDPFASDHVPFINAAIPAVLTIEGADSANGNIHTANDTLDHIDFPLALEILRMNLATAATQLGRPVAPPGGGDSLGPVG